MTVRRVGLMLGLVFGVAGAQVPPTMPTHYASVAVGADLAAKRTVAVTVTSRRVTDPENPFILDKLRERVLDALPKTPFTLATQPDSSDLTLEIVDEPHERWGIYHYQVNAYIFLLLRERANGRVLYCAYRRAGFVHSSTSELMDELAKQAQGKAALPDGDVRTCARAALRPM